MEDTIFQKSQRLAARILSLHLPVEQQGVAIQLNDSATKIVVNLAAAKNETGDKEFSARQNTVLQEAETLIALLDVLLMSDTEHSAECLSLKTGCEEIKNAMQPSLPTPSPVPSLEIKYWLTLDTDVNCDIGCVRTNNEDLILLGEQQFRDAAQRRTVNLTEVARFPAIVADGMGGHAGGEVASQMTVDMFLAHLRSLPDGLNDGELTASLKQWVQNTHSAIDAKGYETPALAGMGTTFCGLLFYEKRTYWMNVGDSRLYRFRGNFLKQLSADHSERERQHDPDQPANLIYNSIGGGAQNVFIEIYPLTPLDGDLFLVCSDGLSDMLANDEIEDLLAAAPVPIAQTLVDAAKAKGGFDNISVILLKVNIPEESENATTNRL
jgi:protein phosphatase